MTEYNYDEADFDDQTDENIAIEDVLQMLFEGTGASGDPAVGFEVSNIESVSGEVEELKVREVIAKEIKDDTVLFTVITPSINVKVKEDSTDYDVRICHESDIPYHYYNIALLNR